MLDNIIRKQTQITLKKTCGLLQTTGGKDKPNIVFQPKSVKWDHRNMKSSKNQFALIPKSPLKH
jgi:hypothetical protein